MSDVTPTTCWRSLREASETAFRLSKSRKWSAIPWTSLLGIISAEGDVESVRAEERDRVAVVSSAVSRSQFCFPLLFLFLYYTSGSRASRRQ